MPRSLPERGGSRQSGEAIAAVRPYLRAQRRAAAAPYRQVRTSAPALAGYAALSLRPGEPWVQRGLFSPGGRCFAPSTPRRAFSKLCAVASAMDAQGQFDGYALARYAAELGIENPDKAVEWISTQKQGWEHRRRQIGAAGGLLSGKARRRRAMPDAKHARKWRDGGASIRSISRDLAVSRSSVRLYLEWVHPGAIALRPWGGVHERISPTKASPSEAAEAVRDRYERAIEDVFHSELTEPSRGPPPDPTERAGCRPRGNPATRNPVAIADLLAELPLDLD